MISQGSKNINSVYRNSFNVPMIALGNLIIFQSENFDDSKILYRIGITSDLHLSQAGESKATVHNKVLKYANLVNSLRTEAGGHLDVLAACGDYTSTGSLVEAQGVASALKGILSQMPETKFTFCYGNHDTCWEGNLSIPEWESILIENGLLSESNIATDVDGAELTGEGVYEWMPVGGPLFIVGLETQSYAPNIYSNRALNWLDEYLDQHHALGPVIILSHAPIMESGVFGADPNLDNNATWAAVDKDGSGNIGALHNILKKYDNVYYFSGHTHRIPMINSHIMSNGYTAINVGSFYGSNLFSVKDTSKGKNIYVDEPNSDSITGVATGMLMEITSDNQARIKRIFAKNTIGGVTGTYNSENDEAYQLTNISFGTASYNKPYSPWQAELGDVNTFSQATRAEGKNIEFKDPYLKLSNANISIDDTTKQQRLDLDMEFNTATADVPVNCYKLQLVDTKGKVLYEKWASGNWNNITTGCANGETHMSAKKLTYTGCTQLIDKTITTAPVVAKFYALDIFGNQVELTPSQGQELLMSGNSTIGFTSQNGTDAVVDLSLTAGNIPTLQVPVYFSQLDGSFNYNQSYRVVFDVQVSDRGKRANGAYENVRVMFSIGTLNGKNCALLLQDGGLLCTSDAASGWSANLGTSGAKLGNTRAEYNETQYVYFDFEFDKENRAFKIDIFNSDGTNNTFTVNIADHMASTEDFVMNPCIIFRTAKFEISNFAFTNI